MCVCSGTSGRSFHPPHLFLNGRRHRLARTRHPRRTESEGQLQPRAGFTAPGINRPTERESRSRSGKEVPISAQGHRVGTGQAPARTYNGTTLASSLIPNTLNECYKASKREAKQD